MSASNVDSYGTSISVYIILHQIAEYSDLDLALLDSICLKSMSADEDAEDDSVPWEGENDDRNEHESLGEAEVTEVFFSSSTL